ncbi:hypothetical protein BGZ47_003932 [Haplosporangium gracile]|nr:hypothetical protein BGZ47_003932 [Haplosporangium gracile]
MGPRTISAPHQRRHLLNKPSSQAASTATQRPAKTNQPTQPHFSTMTHLSLKVASAIVLAAMAAQALPLLGSDCTGADCYQSASSGHVSVGSTTNVVPETNITPITRIQPYVQALAPIVDSDCDYGLLGDYGYGGQGYGGQGYGGQGYGGLGNWGGIGGGYYNRGYYGRGLLGLNRGIYGRGSLLKRNIADSSNVADQASGGKLLFNQFQSQSQSQCAAGDIACQQSVPAQTVDMGSSTQINPSTVVSPSTTYQPQVQSLDSDIQAASAQANTLPQQSVDLGSNVLIQPQTSVTPQTTYQPSVSQLATDVQAAAQQDQSLPQSSVQLGSSVQISPSVQVQPLTTFQPSIQSLPFNIQVEPCSDINWVQGGALNLQRDGAAAFQQGGAAYQQGSVGSNFPGAISSSRLSDSSSLYAGRLNPSFGTSADLSGSAAFDSSTMGNSATGGAKTFGGSNIDTQGQGCQ